VSRSSTDLHRCFWERFHKQVDQQLVNPLWTAGNLFVAVRRCARLQPVQRALARQRFIHFAFARQNLQHRIVTQLLMIVQVLVAERQRTNTLRYHFRHRMPH
jgi:hypothetical protein